MESLDLIGRIAEDFSGLIEGLTACATIVETEHRSHAL